MSEGFTLRKIKAAPWAIINRTILYYRRNGREAIVLRSLHNSQKFACIRGGNGVAVAKSNHPTAAAAQRCARHWVTKTRSN